MFGTNFYAALSCVILFLFQEIIYREITIKYAEEYGQLHEAFIENAGTLDSTIRVNFTIMKTLPEDSIIEVSFLKIESNENITFGNVIRHNLCDFVKNDRLFYVGIKKAGNMPSRCPLLPNYYYLKNYKIDLPPILLPTGDFAFKTTICSKKQEYVRIILTVAIQS